MPIKSLKHLIRQTPIVGSLAAALYVRVDREKWTSRSTIALIGVAQQCYRRSLFSPASLAYRAAIRLSPARQAELLVPLSKSEVRRRRFDQAFASFLRQCDLPAAPEPGVQRAVMPVVARAAKRGSSICAITSVMPRRIEAQQAALRSWQAAGLSVVSVNSASEAAAMRQHFPDITFRVLDKTTDDSHGRPLIPVQALIQAAVQVPADICGIINSDIEFRGEPAFFDRVRREVPGALVFGNRIDFEDAGFAGGKAYRFGYDFFFWERENSALFEETPMVLGLPWWDFWLPLQARGQGLATKRFVTSSMAHIVHPTGYDIPAFLKFGHHFARTLAGVYGRWSDDRAPADRVFLHRLFATAATIPVDEDTDLTRRQVMAMCNLSNCLIDAMAQTVTLRDARLATGTLPVL
jgi:hypothetical protein